VKEEMKKADRVLALKLITFLFRCIVIKIAISVPNCLSLFANSVVQTLICKSSDEHDAPTLKVKYICCYIIAIKQEFLFRVNSEKADSKFVPS